MLKSDSPGSSWRTWLQSSPHQTHVKWWPFDIFQSFSSLLKKKTISCHGLSFACLRALPAFMKWLMWPVWPQNGLCLPKGWNFGLCFSELSSGSNGMDKYFLPFELQRVGNVLLESQQIFGSHWPLLSWWVFFGAKEAANASGKPLTNGFSTSVSWGV